LSNNALKKTCFLTAIAPEAAKNAVIWGLRKNALAFFNG
jgi:hypothetical protein